jgi:hypothetical protein
MKGSTAWLIRIAAAITALGFGTAMVFCLLTRIVTVP